MTSPLGKPLPGPSRRFGKRFPSLRLELLEERSVPTVQVASLAGFQVETAGSVTGTVSVSDDGRYMTFASRADNVVPGDTNGSPDLFLYDRDTRVVTLVSRDLAGNAIGIDVSRPFAISGNGRYVTYVSTADAGTVVSHTNRSGGKVLDWSSPTRDLFRYDRVIGTTALVSRNVDGDAGHNVAAETVSISDDGNVVAFGRSSTRLDRQVHDLNNSDDVYAYNFASDQMTLVSRWGVAPYAADGWSHSPVVSGDGSVVVFKSDADDLVESGDANALTDVYLTRLSDRSTVLVSRKADGTAAGVKAFWPTEVGVSDDGNVVLFGSEADGIVADDSNGRQDVFLFDRAAGTITLVSRNATGKPAGVDSYTNTLSPAVLSGDGNYVAFNSTDNSIVAGDGNRAADVFLFDRRSGSVALVSRTAAGGVLNGVSYVESISDGGEVVAFTTNASNLPGGNGFPVGGFSLPTHVAVFDRAAGSASLVSRTADGGYADGGASAPAVSGDGSAVVFRSNAPGLVAGDVGGSEDAFLFDRAAGAVALASRRAGPASATANAASHLSGGQYQQLAVSDDGRYTVFVSDAGNLVAGDANNLPDVYLFDRATGQVTLVSRDTAGRAIGVAVGQYAGPVAVISGDGNYVAFVSQAGDLVPGDANLSSDVFLFDRRAGTVSQVTRRNETPAPSGYPSYSPSISDDGRFVAFISTAPDLVPDDTNNVEDAFLFDRTTGAVTLVSRDANGRPAGLAQSIYQGGEAWVAVTGDGSAVVFTSTVGTLVAGDDNKTSDVFRYDRASGQIDLVSRTPAGAAGSGYSGLPLISHDGTVISFASTATDLTGEGDTNFAADLYVYDHAAVGVKVRLVSRTTSGTAAGVPWNQTPALSGNGRYLAFVSYGRLTGETTDGVSDVYLFDREADTLVLVSRTPTGQIRGHSSMYPAISDDGGLITFRSGNSRGTDGSAGVSWDIFYYETATQQVRVAGEAEVGTFVGGSSSEAAVSGNGRVIVFSTAVSNFVAGDFNGAADVVVISLERPAVALEPVTSSPRNTPVGSITISFTAAVNGFGKEDLLLTRQVGTGTPVVVSLDDQSVILTTSDNKMFTLSGLDGLTGTTGVYRLTVTAAGSGITDPVTGLPLVAAASTAFEVDATAPTVLATGPAGASADPATRTFYVALSEGVTGIDPSDFVLETTGDVTGASIVAVTGGGAYWLVEVNVGTGDGTIRLDVLDDDSVRDAVGNRFYGIGASGVPVFTTGTPLTLNRKAPTVQSVTRVGSTPTGAATVRFTVTFSEPVTGVDATDFRAVAGGLGGSTAVTAVTGSGTTYTVTVSTGTGDGTLGLYVIDDGSVTDAAGLGLAAGFTGGETYQLDHTGPTVTLSIAGPDPTVDNTPTVMVTASDAGVGLGAGGVAILDVDRNNDGDFVDAGETGYASAAVSPGGVTFDVTSALADGLHAFRVRVSDALGNQGVSPVRTLVVDTTPPTAPAIAGFAADGPVVGPVTADRTPTLTGTAEPGSTLSIFGDGTLLGVVSVDSSGAWSFTTAPLTDGTHSFAARAADLAGNIGLESGRMSVTIDTTGPTVSVVRAAGQPSTTTAAPVRFSVVFSEPVTGFDSAGVALGGTAGATFAVVTGSGTTYEVAVGGMTRTGSVTLDIQPRASRDAVGNASAAATGSDTPVAFEVPVPPPPPLGNPPPLRQVLPREFAVAGGPVVRFFNPDQSERFAVTPFLGHPGNVRVAAADFNADGVADLVAGTGPSGPSRVVVLDGRTRIELFVLDPFEASFTGGVFVAAGDITGDGVADLVITPDEGGGPRVRIFSGAGFGQMADFFGIDDPDFRGGARAAVGDINGDGVGDLLVSAGFGGGPRVAGFDGRTLAGDRARLFGDFFAFETGLRNGVYLTAGDLDGDGQAELVAGGGPGGGPRVSTISGSALLAGTQVRTTDFFAGDTANRGGVRVAVKDLDGDALADLVVGAGAGAGSRVTGYSGRDTLVNGAPSEAFAFDALPGFAGGVFVG